MSRLIDADALIKDLEESHKAHSNNSREESLFRRDLRIIMEQPTAFDVDAVIQELEYIKETHEKDRDYWESHTWKDSVVYSKWDLSNSKVDILEDAIEIVKRGGE